MMRILPIVFVSATVALAAFQQDPKTPSPRPATGQEAKDTKDSTASKADKEADEILATWIAVGSNGELALSQIALQRATDPDVKQFAQKMIDDHGALAQKLRPFAASAAGGRSVSDRGLGGDTGSGDRGGVGGGSSGERGQARQASSARSGDGFDHAGLLQEVGDECLQAVRKDLESKQGSDFDRAYIGSAVMAHVDANAKLTVFQRHASSSLKPILADAQNTVAMHLQRAKDLCRKLEGKSSGGSDSVGGK